ncbi:extracellular solute-binding protein [Paenibacillus ginsengarvi]|uniref:Extracellular solute-binding protein n=1 Tax=Paenibacillus ginsengarvi TaxID=400777 RepID=A0A3B0CTQ2_9BACL|nr:extracellular solute-binding protein [Paenibacillus ginsengarvi]RKN86076.1 extracellular solute-binding protein [Paenibacillus ginsengarvi]
MDSKLRRTTSRSRIELLISTLRDEIITGKRAEGDFLPSELDLCEQYELSKNTVRKGLDVLANEGYIEKIPRIGTKVAKPYRQETVTIHFGYYASLDEEIRITEMLGAFHEAYPNIRVKPVKKYYYNRNREIETKRMLEDGIDVMTVNVTDFEVMGDADQVSEVLEPQEWKEGIYPFLTKPFVKHDRLYAQPFVFTPVILCYNKDHFRELSLPEPDSSWTWDDLRRTGAKLSKATDRFGVYFHLFSENRWPLFLLQNGVVFQRDEHGKYKLDDLKLKEALEICTNVVQDREAFLSYSSDDDRDVQLLFLKEKVSIILATYNSLNAFRDAPFEYDISPVPNIAEPKTLLGIISLGISRESKQKLAARLFVDYMLSHQTQQFIRKHTLSIPSLKSAAEWTGEDFAGNRPHRFDLFREIIPSYRFHSDMGATYNDLLDMRRELKFYWSQLDDLETVLRRIEDKLQAGS